jgi:large subunit ribosomal protein L21
LPRLIALSEAKSGVTSRKSEKPAPCGAKGRVTTEGQDPMFAVIKTGGKQYRVAAEDVITIEKLPAEAGATVTFEQVLMVGDGDKATIGTPLVAGASVAGEVVEQTRGDKIRIFKKKRRQNYRRTAGHRQHLTIVKITDILTDGANKAPKAAAQKAKPGTDETPAAAKAAEAPAKTEKAPETKAETKAKPAKAEAKKPAKAEAKKPAKPAAKKAAPKATAKKAPAKKADKK